MPVQKPQPTKAADNAKSVEVELVPKFETLEEFKNDPRLASLLDDCRDSGICLILSVIQNPKDNFFEAIMTDMVPELSMNAVKSLRVAIIANQIAFLEKQEVKRESAMEFVDIILNLKKLL